MFRELTRKNKGLSRDEYIKAEIKEHMHKTALLELVPEHICGKPVKES